MSVNLLGRPNATQFSKAMLKGKRVCASASADSGATVAAKTYIPSGAGFGNTSVVPANMVALVDAIYIKAYMGAGATTYTITLTTNSQSIALVARGTAAVTSTEDLSIYPNGSMVIMDGQNLQVSASNANV